MTEVSLVKTLASKYKTRCTKIYRQYGKTIKTDEGGRKVILVKRDHELRKPLVTYFGGVSLKWNKWVNLGERLTSQIWSNRSELVQRLEDQGGSQNKVEVHHVKKLTALARKGTTKIAWQKRMMARNRKTLIVCQQCHGNIHTMAGTMEGSFQRNRLLESYVIRKRSCVVRTGTVGKNTIENTIKSNLNKRGIREQKKHIKMLKLLS